MELLKRTKELHQRVRGLAAAQGRHEEGKELVDFKAEKLGPRLERLANVRAISDALEQRDVALPTTLVRASLPAKVALLKDRFIPSPTRTTLVAPNGWPALQPVVDAGLASAESALLDAWSTYCLGKVPSDTVAELKQDPNIVSHPENRQPLQEYEKLRQHLARASSILPRTHEQIDDFVARAAEAHALLGRLNREPPSPTPLLPPDVQRFLQALQGHGAASLDLVTAEVLAWLSSTGRQAQFEVRRKAS